MLHLLDDVGARLLDGRVRSAFLDEMVRLSEAAWRVFPSASVGKTETCACCLPEDVRRRLRRLPREAWTANDLAAFANSAHAEGPGGAARLRYLVPRFLQIVLRREEDEADDIHDVAMHHVGTSRAKGAWPQAETSVLEAFYGAYHCHAAVCELAYRMLPENEIADGDFDEEWIGNILTDAVSIGADPVPLVLRAFAEGGHAGAYIQAEMLTNSQTKLYKHRKLDWDPIWHAGVGDAPARVLAALTGETARDAYERLVVAAPETEEGGRIASIASAAVTLAEHVRWPDG